MCRVECLISSQLAPVPIYTACWTEAHVCEQLAQVAREAERPGLDALTTTPLLRECAIQIYYLLTYLLKQYYRLYNPTWWLRCGVRTAAAGCCGWDAQPMCAVISASRRHRSLMCCRLHGTPAFNNLGPSGVRRGASQHTCLLKFMQRRRQCLIDQWLMIINI